MLEKDHWFYKLTEKCQQKLKQDVFYFSMVEKGFSYFDLLKSGWIDTEYTLDENLKNQEIFTTNVLDSLYEKDSEEICILLNTGSYAPAHNGHVEMMLQAKKVLEKNGFNIDMILFSPSHDKYVLNKTNDIKHWNISNRINELYSKIESYSYSSIEDKKLFLIDSWEGVYCNCPVNFTDVILKIESNIQKFLNKRAKFFYVFGSDNHDFSYCFSSLPEYFKSKYFAVCIERDGSPIINKIESSNIFYSKNESFSNEKSRDIRKTIYSNNLIPNIEDSIYGIRLDEDTALKSWILKYPNYKNQLHESYILFHNQLKEVIGKYSEIQTISIPVLEQKKLLNSLDIIKPLNLDVCTNEDARYQPLHYSRLFLLNDIQKKPLTIINRNNFENLNIKPGNYSLIDDDIASGATLNLVKNELLKKEINIIDSFSLLDIYLRNKNINQSLYDIVDTRDFLLGANEGGLFCKTIDGFTRIPYFSPWVNLFTRAKIPFKNIKQMNLEILKINILFFQTNNIIQFEDIPPNLHKFLFKNINSSSLSDWCRTLFYYLEKNMIKSA
jgi:nicotinic acid mononucleotide adenylyltransferase